MKIIDVIIITTMKKIYLYSNEDNDSLETKNRLKELLEKENFSVVSEYSSDIDLVISIGGDGTFLSAVNSINYSNIPVLGVNTGHLGFFAEYSPDELNDVVKVCQTNDYSIQLCKTIKTVVTTKNNEIELNPALNDVFIKHGHSSIAHLDLFIGNEFIENFSGDGILISTSAGSTAYNYSLGGSIVDQRLDLLQINPVAPTNNSIYRSFTSSLLAPANEKIVIETKNDDLIIVIDGIENKTEDIKKITISIQDKVINIIRRKDYSFWKKVKEKFL